MHDIYIYIKVRNLINDNKKLSTPSAKKAEKQEGKSFNPTTVLEITKIKSCNRLDNSVS